MEAVHALMEMKLSIQKDINFLKNLKTNAQRKEQDKFILQKWNHQIEALNVAGESLTR
jgi:hypothetical protein